ncbi:uncharacterized protein LOC129583976 [Paramacrobiotus metropolitanus]|uniref:uncharacterized protein LOC129583976 n=1 Tax=Paramacrobiotus metropolitanus TaxID=2943436 RepID=UPI0024464831|nr:uncharacterized protein LOC129583976 [Paramacrobiotus metropolitanus]
MSSNRIRYNETLMSHRIQFSNDSQAAQPDLPFSVRPLRKSSKPPSLILLPSKFELKRPESSIAAPFKHAFSQDYEEVVQIVPEDIAHYEDFQPADIPRPPRMFMNHTLGRHVGAAEQIPSQAVNATVHEDLEDVEYHYDDEDFSQHVGVPKPSVRRRHNVTGQGFQRLRHNATLQGPVYEEPAPVYLIPSSSVAPTVALRKKVTKSKSHVTTKGPTKRMRYTDSLPQRRTPSRRLHIDDNFVGLDKLRHTNVSGSDRLSFHDSVRTVDRPGVFPAPVRRNASARSRAKLPLGNQPRYRYGNFTRLPSRIPPTAVPTMYTVLDFFEMSTPGKIESTTMEPGLHINDTATGNDRLLHIENNYAQDGISFGNDTSYLELQLSTAYPPVQLRRNYTSKPVGITRPPRISVGTYLFNYTAKYHRTAAPYLEPNPERLRFDDSRWADDLSRRNETFTRPVAHLTTKPYRLYANATDLQRLNDSGLFDEEVFTVAPVFDRNATLMYKPPTRSPNITVVLPSAQEMTEHDEDYIYDYEEGRVPHNVAGMAKPGLSRRKHMKNYRESRLRHNMSLTDRIRYSDPSSAPERIRFDDVKTVHELPFQLNTSLLSQPAAPASFNQVVPVNETAVSRMRHDDTEAVSDRMKYTNQTYSVNPRLAQDPEVLDLTEYGEIDEVLRLRFEDTLGLSDRIKYHNRTGITMGPHYTDMLSEYPFSSEAPMYSAVDDGKARMRHNDTMVFVDENRYGGTTKAYKPIFNRTLPYASLPPTLPPLVYKPRTNDSRMRIGALDEPQRMSHMDDLSAHEVPAPIASQQFTPVYAPIQQLSLRIDATAETIHRLQHDETLGVLNRTTYDESLDAPEAPGAYIGQPMTGAAVTAPVALIDMTYQPFTNRSAVYSHRLSSAELHTDDVHEVAAPMINTSQSITATAAIPVFRAAPMRYDDTVLTDNRIKHNETLGISSRMVYDQVLEDSEASGPAIEPQRTAIATTSTLLEPSPFAPASNRSRLTTDHTGDQDRLSHMDDLNAHEAAAPFTTHRVQFAPPYGLAATQEPRHNGTAARLRHNITLGFADHPEQSGIPEIAKVFRPAFVPQPPVMVVPSAPSLPLASVIYIPAVNGSIAYSDRLRFHDTAGQDRLSHTDDLSAHEAALPVPVSAVYSDRLRFHDTAGEDRLFHTDDLSAHEAAAPTSAVYDDRLRFHDTTGQARLSHIGDRSAHEAAVPVPVSAVYSDRLRFHNTTGQDRLSHTDDLSSHEAAIPISAVAFVTPASPGGMNSTYKNSSVQRLSNMDDLHVPETAPLLSLNQPPPMRYVPVEIRSRVRHNDSVGVSSRLGHNETFGVAERLTYDQTLEVQEGHSPVPALLPAVQSTAAARLFTDAPDQLKRTDLETIEDGRSDQYPTFQPGVRLVQYVDDGVARLRHNQTLSSDRVQHDEHDFAYIAVNASLSRLPGIQVGLPEIPQLQVGADVHPLDDRLAYHHLSQINHFTLPEQPRDNRLKHDYILAPESDHQEFQPHFPAFIPVLRPGVHHGIPSQYPADRLRFQPFALSDGIRHNHSFGPPERMRYNDDMRVPELPYVAQPQNIRTGFATDYLPSVGLYPIETDAYRQAWQPSTWTLPDDLSPQIPDIDMDTGVTPFYAQNATVSPIAGISAQATPAPMRNVTKHRDLHETDYTDSADYPIEVHRMPRTTPLPQRLRDHPNVIERLQHNESISEQDRLKFQEGFKPDNYSEQLPPYQGIPPNQSALGYVPDRDRLGINVTSWTDNMLPEFSWLPYYPGAYYQNASLPPVLESPKPTYAQVVPSASRLVYSRDDHPTEALRPIPTLPVQQKPIEAYQPVPTIPRITYHDAPIVFDGLRSQYDVPERLRHFESLPVPEILPTVNVTLQRPVLPYIPASIYPELHNESERTYFTEQSKFEGPGLPQPQLTADRMKYSEHSGQPMEHEEARSPHVQNISLSQPQRYPLPTLSAALPHIPSTPFWTNATVASPRHPDFIPPLRNITSTVSAFVPVPLHPVHPGSDQIVPVIPTQNVSMVLPRAQRKFGHSGDFDGAHGMNRLRHNISLEEYHKEPAMPVTQGAPKAVFPNTSYMEAQRHDAPPGTTADTFLLSPQKFSPTNQTFFTELHPIRPTEILPSPTAPLFIGKMNISKITDEDVAQKIRAQQAKPYKHPNKYMLSREAMNDELVESGYDEKAMFVFPPRYAPSMRDHRKMHEHVTRKRPLAQRDPVEGDYEEKDSLLEADVAAESDTDTTYDQLEPESHGADYGDSLQVSAVEKSKKTHSKVKVTVLKQKAGKDGQTDQSGTFDQQEAYPEKSNRLRYYEDDEVENTKELQSSRSKHRKPAKEPTPSAPPTEASNNLTVQVRLKNVVKVIKGGKRAQLPLSPYSTMIVPELVPNPNNLSLPTVNTKIHEVTIHNRSVNAADNVVLNVNAFLGNDSTSTMHSVKVKLVQSNNAPMAEACRNRLRIENSEYVRHVYCYRNSTDVPIKVVVTGGSGAFSFSIIKDFRGVHDGRRFRFEETGGDLYPKVSVRPDVGANDPNYLRPDHEYHVPVRVVDDVCEDSVETFLSISYMCRRSRRFG